MNANTQLLGLLERREARVGIIGLGYVGLPLAIEVAGAGFLVRGYDVDPRKVARIEAGDSYIQDVPSARLGELVESGRLSAATGFDSMAEMDAVVICVPTPLSKTKDPDISYVVAAAEQVAAHLRRGQLVVLESTTYPGTTRDLLKPMFTRSGLEIGVDFHLAFSPERVDPGNPRFGVKNTPRVVGGETPACARAACALYRSFIDTVVPVSSTASAEMAKLLENTFRAVNIAMVNEVAIMCRKLGIDTWEVIEAAGTKPFGFMKFYPGPGLGGHCIPVDPHYLSWILKSLNYNARFIQLAGEINSAMPSYVVDLVADALNEDCRPIKGSRVLMLGVAYKPDIDDVRESPALDVMELLLAKGADLVYSDPHVPEVRLGDHLHRGVEVTPELLGAVDCVVIATNHRSFDYDAIARAVPLVVDTRNAMRDVPPRRARIVRL